MTDDQNFHIQGLNVLLENNSHISENDFNKMSMKGQ